MSRNRHGLYIAMTLALAGLIAWGALREVPPIPKLFDGQDKLEHFLAFGALMMWLTAFVRPSRWLLAFGVSTLAAVSLELGQAFLTSSRSASLADFLASLTGILAATAFIQLARKTLRSKSPSAS